MFPNEMLAWLPGVLQQLPTTFSPAVAKSQFLVDLTK